MPRRLFDATPPFHIGPGRTVRVCLDSEGTLADITALNGDPIANSELVIGADGSVPAFLGPADGTAALTVQSTGRIASRVSQTTRATDVVDIATIVVVDAGADAATPRPEAAAAVYWRCAAGVTPASAEVGDLIFNASA